MLYKKNSQQIFFSMFRWYTRKNEVFLTVPRLNEVRKQEKKVIKNFQDKMRNVFFLS